VLVIGGAAGYFLFVQGPGDGDRVSGEELRTYVEQQLTASGATFESVTYEGGSDTVRVTNLDAPNVIPFYKTFKVAKFEIRGGDKRALELLFDETKAKEAEGDDYRRIAKELRAEDVNFELDMSAMAKAAASASGEEGADTEVEIDRALGGLDISGSLKSYSIKDYAIKPTGEPISALFKMPDMSSPDAFNEYMSKAAKFASAQKYGPFEAVELKYNGTMEEAKLDASVDSMKSEGYSDGVLGKTEVGPTVINIGGEAIQEELGGSITASMESAVVESLDMAKMLVAMQDGSFIPKDPEKAPILNAWAPVFGDYKVTNVKVTVPKMGDFTLEELSASNVKNVAGLALGGRGELKNLVIPEAALADSGAKPVMEALGAKELRVNVSTEATFDEKDHVWDVSKFVIDVDKFGSLNTQFRFGGMNFLNDLVGMPAGEFVSSGMMNRVLQEMTFARLQLTYKDQGAVDYVLNSMAQQSGMDRAQLAQQYLQQFDAMRAQFGDIPALNELSTALAAFLNDPKSLTLKFNPQEPVPLGELSAMGMAAPAQLVEKLGFSASANK